MCTADNRLQALSSTLSKHCMVGTQPMDDSSSNDANPPLPAQRLDTTVNNINLHPGRGAAPFLPSRAQSPSIALSFSSKREEGKISPPVTISRRRSATKDSIKIQGTISKKQQPIGPDALQGLRENMREELLQRLGKSNLGGTKQSPEMQAAFANRLEELLFKTSKSVDAYADSKTLDRRLKALMIAMQKRKARNAPPTAAMSAMALTQVAALQKRKAFSSQAFAAMKQRRSSTGSTNSVRSSQDQRKRDVLSTALGQAKMARVFKVIAEIKLIQLGREVTAGKPYAPIPMCTKLGCSFSVPCQGDQKVPKVVRDLFFNTAIVPAYEKSPVERLPSLPWNQLLTQGETRLADYHEWYRQRQASKQPQPDGFRTI